MGQLNFDNTNNDTQNVKSMINDNISSYMDSTGEYSRYFQNAPNFVTYFALDMQHSKTDPGLGNVIEVVGNESPLRYNRINNLPLFNIDEVQPQFEYNEDTGMEGTMEGQAVLAPGTIQPQPNDYFIFTYHEHKIDMLKAFKVTNVQMSAINSNTYFQISYVEDSGIDLTYLDTKQKVGDYEAIYDHLGTEKITIIEESAYQKLKFINKIKDKLFTLYTDEFFNRRLNSFLYYEDDDDNDKYLYDGYLHYFIRQNNIFLTSNSLMKDIIVSSQTVKRRRDYRNSIYYGFENYDNSHGLTNDYMTKPMTNQGVFNFYGGSYDEMIYIKSNSPGLLVSNFDEMVSSYKHKYDLNGLDMYNRFFIKYLSNHLEDIDEDDMNDLNTYLDNMNFELKDYLLLPIIVLILNNMVKAINKEEGGKLFV